VPLDARMRGMGRKREPRNVVFRDHRDGPGSGGSGGGGHGGGGGSSPHFKVWVGAEDRLQHKVWAVKRGRDNVFHAIVLFLYACKDNRERENECLVRCVCDPSSGQHEADADARWGMTRTLRDHRRLKETRALIDILFAQGI